jgi:hypothetical protein
LEGLKIFSPLLILLRGSYFMEIGSGAEGPIRAGENTDFLRVVIFKVENFLIKLFGRIGVDCVASVLAIYENGGDAVGGGGAGDCVSFGFHLGSKQEGIY